MTALWTLWPSEGARMLRSPEVHIWAAVIVAAPVGATICALRAFSGMPRIPYVGAIALLLYNALFALANVAIVLWGGVDDLAMFLLF